jgi:hypothetical protein
MSFRSLLITLLAFAVSWNVAWASDDEIRERRALLIFDGLQQWGSLKYQFDDQYSNHGGGNSYTHQFQENYNANLSMSVISPHLFNMSLAFTGGLEQDNYHSATQGSTTGDSFRYNYHFTGSGLDRSITPFTLVSYRNTETVISPFSPTFTTDSTGNELHVSLHNSLLPSEFNYTRRTVESSGRGDSSSTTTSNSISYSATHNYKGFSTTGLSVALSDASGSYLGNTDQSSRAYSANLNNNLQWGIGNKYTLATLLQLYDSMDQSIPQRSASFSESFQDHLGKALDFVFNYSVTSTNTVDFAGKKADTLVNTGEAVLSHRLFESVTTKLRAKYAYNEMLSGRETRWSGSGELNYIKHLPAGKYLTAAFSATHEQVDNRLGSSLLSVVDENHPGVHQGDIIMLPLTGVLKTVLRVKSLNPIFTYSEGVDYTVDYGFGRITIMPGGRIDRNGVGTDLLISYTVGVDPDVLYATDSVHASSSLTFKRGKYSVGGVYARQWMSLMGGADDNSLRDSSMATIYFSGSADPLTYRVSYTENSIGELQSKIGEGTAQFQRDTLVGRFSLVGSDRFSWFGATSTQDSYHENTATVSVAGMRGLGDNCRLTASANLFDDRSSLRSPRDIMSLRASLLYLLNKVSVTVDGKTSWTLSGKSVTRDDTITVDLLRYF